MYDIAIIGAGICGCALAYELSAYDVRVLLLEKENDVSLGATKANSAIVHAGYDPPPGTLMARHNVRGNALTKELCAALDVPYRQCGSLVIAFSESELSTLRVLFERGVKNEVEGLKLLSRDETLKREPALSKNVLGALYAPTASIISPWELAIALAETAVKNGVSVALGSEVLSIERQNGVFELKTSGKDYRARFVVNAAGTSSEVVNAMVSRDGFKIIPNRGEYFILDKSQGDLVRHVVFRCPTKLGKGVLVSPTVHGNLIVGPNAEDAENVSTTSKGLEQVRNEALDSVPGIAFGESIRNFAGLRAHSNQEDFIIGEAPDCPGFFNVAGIKSPGLTSAASIAKDVAQMLFKAGLPELKKPDFISTRRVVRFKERSAAEKARLISDNPAYGQIVCRCETVTEGEIIDALRSPLPPVSLDGIKRRCGAGMGRCQGGFCGVRVQRLIARELGVPYESVTLDGAGTYIVTGRTKGAGV